ncbi:MAG TPA: sugar phosphate isomerase/epimerase family protein, partial [Opitutaceae bacterium]|nr:sugar phosphate isomerase/epimerase family protein [Opitutaceae bacterium]
PLEEAVRRYRAAGIKGITVWRETLEGRDAAAAGRMIREQGLSIASLCRGGFFPALTGKDRIRAIDENRRCIDQAAALGAPLLVLVCGAVPGQSLTKSRRQIADGIAEILPHAAAAGVKLGIEPLHPMYAADRSAINTISQARAICDDVKSPWLGIVVDVYHVWWDDWLKHEITACGHERSLFAFHISDWKTPVDDVLNDRALMGQGCIPLRQIRRWIEAAGFTGFIEVEIFSKRHWARDQTTFVEDIKTAYLEHA